MQKEIVSHDIKSTSQFSVKGIFLDDHHWDVYKYDHGDDLRQVEVDEVKKMLHCKDGSRGFFVYHCPRCDESRIVYLGCNSRLCSCCGKNYTDKWSKSLKKAMFDVVHRHIVMSVPNVLWEVMKRFRRRCLKVYMDAAISAINNTLSYFLNKRVMAGVIVVLHPFARDLGFKPHLHLLITEGGFDKKGRFVRKRFIPAEAMRKTWQYQVLNRFRDVLPGSPGFARFIDGLFKRYPNGFYVYLPKKSRITSKRKVGRYVARYIRHPAIANTRICGYDGGTVRFWYKDNEGVTYVVTMDVFEFIEALIQHVPDRQFKMIRYYGAYARRWKSRFGVYVQESITQSKLGDFSQNRGIRCPVCGEKMEFVMYWKTGPPSKEVFGEKIDDWHHLSVRVDAI
ncbi:MAG: transposase [Candidatus Thermoplasmatota archaeon]|nr:transposase [Candidatus Thermoplasmatota archaeon]